MRLACVPRRRELHAIDRFSRGNRESGRREPPHLGARLGREHRHFTDGLISKTEAVEMPLIRLDRWGCFVLLGDLPDRGSGYLLELGPLHHFSLLIQDDLDPLTHYREVLETFLFGELVNALAHD